MSLYVFIDEFGIVSGMVRTSGEAPVDSILAPENADIGWVYDSEAGTLAPYAEPLDTTSKFNLSNLVITRNGGQAVPQNGNKYYLDAGDTVEVVSTIEGGEAINASIVKLPITRHADDQPTPDELYFTGSIVNGVLTVSGTFTQSSNYKALMTRCNRALDRLPAGFHVVFDDIDFLV
jgi:sulfur carrier protein ThiS